MKSRQPKRLHSKERDEWVLRCGLFWPWSKTFTAPRSVNNDRIINSQDF